VERADIAAMVNAMREAFLAAGPNVREKRTVAGHAFLVDGRALGQIQRRANALRARLWLPDKERGVLEARPTFDRDSGWLFVVSDEDVRFVRGLAPVAFKAALSGAAGATPPSPRAPEPVARPAARPMQRPVAEAEKETPKKKAAPRRPPSRS